MCKMKENSIHYPSKHSKYLLRVSIFLVCVLLDYLIIIFAIFKLGVHLPTQEGTWFTEIVSLKHLCMFLCLSTPTLVRQNGCMLKAAGASDSINPVVKLDR